MSEAAYVFGAVAFGVALTSVFLSVGIWIGYRLGKTAVPPPNDISSQRLERLLRELAWCAKLSDRAASHAQQVSKLSRGHAVPGDLAAALHELLMTVKSLTQRLQKAGQEVSGPATTKAIESTRRDVPTQSKPAPKGDRSDLSPKELGQFTAMGQSHIEDDGQAKLRRYPYDCLQRLLEWDDPNGPLPSVADTVVVRCHDVSIQGVSFFWPDEPDFNHLLISLGNDDEMVFMAAEIMHSKPVYMHGEWQYLVGCRFTKRMREFSEQWKKQAVSLDEVQVAARPLSP